MVKFDMRMSNDKINERMSREDGWMLMFLLQVRMLETTSDSEDMIIIEKRSQCAQRTLSDSRLFLQLRNDGGKSRPLNVANPKQSRSIIFGCSQRDGDIQTLGRRCCFSMTTVVNESHDIRGHA